MWYDLAEGERNMKPKREYVPAPYRSKSISEIEAEEQLARETVVNKAFERGEITSEERDGQIKEMKETISQNHRKRTEL
jgi:hypothetical protein